MSNPRAFLSFDFDHDQSLRTLFAGQATTSSPTPFVVEDWSSKSVLDESNWESLIAPKIRATNMCIVLVGNHMGSADGVAKEVRIATQWSVPVFGVYVDGANSSSGLPVGLPRNRTISWTWSGIASAVNQMMREGKNAN
jgi:hypothetical protein